MFFFLRSSHPATAKPRKESCDRNPKNADVHRETLNLNLTSSCSSSLRGESLYPSAFLLAGFAPAGHQRMRDGKMVEHARDHEIHQVLRRLRVVIEAGVGRQDHRACARQLEHVLQMDRGKRCFPRHQYELE